MKHICFMYVAANQLDHNLDLSLGSSGSKRSGLEVMDEDNNGAMMDQRVPFAMEPDWRSNNRTTRPKVSVTFIHELFILLNINHPKHLTCMILSTLSHYSSMTSSSYPNTNHKYHRKAVKFTDTNSNHRKFSKSFSSNSTTRVRTK